ncbi:unnamed protein product [[Candida] boidinii]|uniref:Unnamed protein product n=1 Tax=Candida boidinii TaxID=5477 RepID=A0A9W6T3J9_CANBO|nr:unnamed protein product [[Candida] boidinii]
MYLYSVAFAVGTVVAVAGIAVVVVVVGIAVGLTKQSHLIGMKYLMFVEWTLFELLKDEIVDDGDEACDFCSWIVLEADAGFGDKKSISSNEADFDEEVDTILLSCDAILLLLAEEIEDEGDDEEDDDAIEVDVAETIEFGSGRVELATHFFISYLVLTKFSILLSSGE